MPGRRPGHRQKPLKNASPESWTPGRLIEYWHLLSLDAPTVAVVWAWGFARAFHLARPPIPLALLFAGTWLLYVADRIFDGFHQERARHRARHLFYLRHRALAVAAAVPVGVLITWLFFFRLSPEIRLDDEVIVSLAAAYFLPVHLKERSIQRWFPKELMVALIFALATITPAWVELDSGLTRDRAIFILLATLFAALCWLNCIAIEKWEQPCGAALARRVSLSPRRRAQVQTNDCTARWGQKHLRRISIAIAAVAAFIAALLLHSEPPAAKLYFAAALSAAVFLLLDRRPFSTFHLRVAADAALLTPLLVFLVR